VGNGSSDPDRLPTAVSRAQRHDPTVRREVDAAHNHIDSEDCRGERHSQVLLQHREQAGQLLVVAVGIDGGFIDHGVEFRPAQRTHGTTVTVSKAVTTRLPEPGPRALPGAGDTIPVGSRLCD
jgi:hypothetical protein